MFVVVCGRVGRYVSGGLWVAVLLVVCGWLAMFVVVCRCVCVAMFVMVCGWEALFVVGLFVWWCCICGLGWV